MDVRAVALIFFSAVCHAGWNYLSQYFRRPLVSMWLMVALGLLLCLPFFLLTSHSLTLTWPLVGLVLA